MLWLHGLVSDSAGTQSQVSAYGVTDDSWTEAGITWNTKPGLGTSLATTPCGADADWLAWDVTAFLQAQYAADGTATIALAQAAPGPGVFLNSRANSTNPPFLQIVT